MLKTLNLISYIHDCAYTQRTVERAHRNCYRYIQAGKRPDKT